MCDVVGLGAGDSEDRRWRPSARGGRRDDSTSSSATSSAPSATSTAPVTRTGPRVVTPPTRRGGVHL